MNPTQAGQFVKSLLLAFGVSSTFLGYFNDALWTAIGGLVVTLSVTAWQIISWRTAKLISNIAKRAELLNQLAEQPGVVKIIVADPALAKAAPSPKVVAKRKPRRKVTV